MQLFFKKAVKIIESCAARGENFYLQLWFDSPHKPLEAIPPFAQPKGPPNSGKGVSREEQKAMYSSMVQAMDQQVGVLLSALERLNIAENTIVVFLSDNGPADNGLEIGPGSAAMLHGRKRYVRSSAIPTSYAHSVMFSWANFPFYFSS